MRRVFGKVMWSNKNGHSKDSRASQTKVSDIPDVGQCLGSDTFGYKVMCDNLGDRLGS